MLLLLESASSGSKFASWIERYIKVSKLGDHLDWAEPNVFAVWKIVGDAEQGKILAVRAVACRIVCRHVHAVMVCVDCLVRIFIRNRTHRSEEEEDDGKQHFSVNELCQSFLPFPLPQLISILASSLPPAID